MITTGNLWTKYIQDYFKGQTLCFYISCVSIFTHQNKLLPDIHNHHPLTNSLIPLVACMSIPVCSVECWSDLEDQDKSNKVLSIIKFPLN